MATEREVLEAMDEADRILIATVDTAIEVGVGRTFETGGHTVRVEALEDDWVRLAVMRMGIPTGRLSLPRKIREVAIKATAARLELEARRG